MNYFMRVNALILVSIALAGLLTGLSTPVMAECNDEDPTCPDFDSHPDHLPSNANVSVTVVGDIGSGDGVAAVDASMADVSDHATSNGSGVTFSTEGGGEDSPSVTVEFYYGDPTDVGCDGSGAGCSFATSYNSDGTTQTAQIYIFPNAPLCGGPCFDPSSANYAQSIQDILTHEFYHLLGAGDAHGTASSVDPVTGLIVNSLNIVMGPYNGFSPNNSGVPRPINRCDDENVSDNR